MIVTMTMLALHFLDTSQIRDGAVQALQDESAATLLEALPFDKRELSKPLFYSPNRREQEQSSPATGWSQLACNEPDWSRMVWTTTY